MLEQLKEKTANNEGFINNAIRAAEEVAKTGLKVERLKVKAANAIDDGIVDAKRMVKRGVYAAEDLIDDTAHRIKKDPWVSVGVTFGVGFGLGALFGWVITYKMRPSREH